MSQQDERLRSALSRSVACILDRLPLTSLACDKQFDTGLTESPHLPVQSCGSWKHSYLRNPEIWITHHTKRVVVQTRFKECTQLLQSDLRNGDEVFTRGTRTMRVL